jgi:hypothetical protein
MYTDDILRNLVIIDVAMDSRKEWIGIYNMEEKIIKKNTLYVIPYDDIKDLYE